MIEGRYDMEKTPRAVEAMLCYRLRSYTRLIASTVSTHAVQFNLNFTHACRYMSSHLFCHTTCVV